MVQVAAFREKELAERAARELDLANLVVMPTQRDGEDWYVILLGAWPTYALADEAGRRFVEVKGGSYWVRNAADLQAILKR